MTTKSIKRALAQFKREHPGHDKPEHVEEHGNDYVNCFRCCGAIYGIHQNGAGDFVYKLVSAGDETCPV
ncbi:MAG TPA: hypothetical protein VM529_24850 [Gemmata sp.]|jgi:hypothetical protein|nr:hypothetical protein [Gemmata sp.]